VKIHLPKSLQRRREREETDDLLKALYDKSPAPEVQARFPLFDTNRRARELSVNTSGPVHTLAPKARLERRLRNKARAQLRKQRGARHHGRQIR
jgi:hypothetical protein